jgi:hypothetical protein
MVIVLEIATDVFKVLFLADPQGTPALRMESIYYQPTLCERR